MSDRSSKKQRDLLLFIDGFIKGNGYGPSYREVMRALGYKSVSTVAIHIDGLIQKGYLRKKDHSARSIEVVTLQDGSSTHSTDSPTLVEMLENEINIRLAKDNPAATNEAALLIEAAEILGSKHADDLKKRFSDSPKP